MTPTTPVLRAALAVSLLAAALHAGAAERREKIAVMKVEAPELSRAEIASLRDRLEVGVTDAVATRLQVITKDSAAASVGGGDRLLACMEAASCDAEIGGALGVDYFVSASARRTPLGLELGVTLLRTGRDVSLLRKSVKVFPTVRELLDGTAAHAEAVTRTALGAGGRRPAPAAGGAYADEEKDLAVTDTEEVVVSFESEPDGATVLVDGAVVCKETPCRRRIAAGGHEASFQRERYATVNQQFTTAKGAAVRATLAPRFGWISVETTPPGLAITIDGASAGPSPVAWREADPRMVDVAVSDPCWLTAGERVVVRAGERRTVKLSPRPRIAGLKVDAADDAGNAVEADVTVDGTVVGPTGATLKVPLCSRRVSVPLGNQIFEGELKLEEAKVTVVQANPATAVPPAAAPTAAGSCPGPAWTCVLPGPCPLLELKDGLCAVGTADQIASYSLGMEAAKTRARREMAALVQARVDRLAQAARDNASARGAAAAKLQAPSPDPVQRALEKVLVPKSWYDAQSRTYFAIAVLDARSYSDAVKPLEEVADAGGGWTHADSRKVAEEMAHDLMTRPWLASATQAGGGPPRIVIQTIRNEDAARIDTDSLADELQWSLVRSGRVHATSLARRARGPRADYALSGKVRAAPAGAAGVRYQIDLKLLELSSNQIVWNGRMQLRE